MMNLLITELQHNWTYGFDEDNPILQPQQQSWTISFPFSPSKQPYPSTHFYCYIAKQNHSLTFTIWQKIPWTHKQWFRLRLPPTPIMPIKPLPTAPLHLIKLTKRMESTILLLKNNQETIHFEAKSQQNKQNPSIICCCSYLLHCWQNRFSSPLTITTGVLEWESQTLWRRW